MKSDTPRTDARGTAWMSQLDILCPTCGDPPVSDWIIFAGDLERELNAEQAENTRLRAALANSDQPCAYCTLPADEIAKCPSGFPGCGRMDDAMGCPELGAAVQLAAAQARIAELEGELEQHVWKYSPAMAETRIEQLFSENERLKAKIAELEAAPTPLPRPDKPGWWWELCGGGWLMRCISYRLEGDPGQWLPATPPPAPKTEEEKP